MSKEPVRVVVSLGPQGKPIRLRRGEVMDWLGPQALWPLALRSVTPPPPPSSGLLLPPAVRVEV